MDFELTRERGVFPPPLQATEPAIVEDEDKDWSWTIEPNTN